MSILFWNVQRIGISTPEDRSKMFETTLKKAFKSYKALQLVLLCEVVGDTMLTDFTIDKQGHVHKRDRLKNAAQLGYAAFGRDGITVPLSQVDIPRFNDLLNKRYPRKGGNIFMNQSIRNLVSAGEYNNREVYLYHANASGQAQNLVSWAAEALRLTGTNFVLIGDFNCTPPELKARMTLLDIEKNKFEICSGGSTYNAKVKPDKTYDYAIASKSVDVKHIRKSEENTPSDHLPIVVSW